MTTTHKIDIRKKYHHLYSPSARAVQEIVVPCLTFASIEGQGRPGSAAFQNAIGALYGVSYGLKFAHKASGENYTIGPLEGLWWTKTGDFDDTKQDDWHWKLMILQPDFITQNEFDQAVEELKIKKPNPAIAHLRLESFDEGPCVQTMHVGPYADEAPTIARLESYAAAHELQTHGKHHEIYMGDPRRTKPERLKTILRHPVYQVTSLQRS